MAFSDITMCAAKVEACARSCAVGKFAYLLFPTHTADATATVPSHRNYLDVIDAGRSIVCGNLPPPVSVHVTVGCPPIADGGGAPRGPPTFLGDVNFFCLYIAIMTGESLQ